MAIFHFTVTQTKRSKGQSAIASAAYRSGERLYSEYYGEYSDYTRKGGVICSDILLPSHAPPEYADRQTLWNAVEKAERGKNAQLAYSFDIALQNEFSLEENIALARQLLLENFVSRGMVVDFAVHQPDREDGGIPNPHFHVPVSYTHLDVYKRQLLSLMLSLPENWDYTMKGLARICKDGNDSISGGIRELEEHGYLIRERVRGANGQLGSIEYTILEQPKEPTPAQEKPIRENPVQVNPTLVTPVQEEPAQLNKDRSSNDPSRTDLSSTELSNPIQSNPPTPTGARMGTDRMGARECCLLYTS